MLKKEEVKVTVYPFAEYCQPFKININDLNSTDIIGQLFKLLDKEQYESIMVNPYYINIEYINIKGFENCNNYKNEWYHFETYFDLFEILFILVNLLDYLKSDSFYYGYYEKMSFIDYSLNLISEFTEYFSLEEAINIFVENLYCETTKENEIDEFLSLLDEYTINVLDQFIDYMAIFYFLEEDNIYYYSNTLNSLVKIID